MRKLAALLFLCAGSVSADPAAEVARMMVRGMRTPVLMATAMAVSRDAVERLAESDDPVVKSRTQERVMGLFEAHFRSPDFERNVVTPWLVRTFTIGELEEIAAFGRTEAGKKLLAAWPRLAHDLVSLSMEHLQTDIAEQALGSRQKAEEAVEAAKIRRTMADMGSLATALEAYQTDHDRWPAATGMDSLRPQVSPLYMRSMPDRDGWGRPYAYSVDAEGTSYELVSAGPDGVMGSADDLSTRSGDDTRMVIRGGAEMPIHGPLRVGGDVRAPVVISRVEPVMTDEAVRARISGIVILECVIDETGRVAEARVLKPLPFGLDQAAVDAVRQWRFRPGTMNGQPVPVIFNLTINFLPKGE